MASFAIFTMALFSVHYGKPMTKKDTPRKKKKIQKVNPDESNEKIAPLPGPERAF